MKRLHVFAMMAFSILSTTTLFAQGTNELSYFVNADGLAALEYKYKSLLSDFAAVCDYSEGENQAIAAACSQAKQALVAALSDNTWDKDWIVTHSETTEHLRTFKLRKALPFYHTDGINYVCEAAYSIVARKVYKDLVVADISAYCN